MRRITDKVFFKEVLKKFANFMGKYLCWSPSLIKLQAWRHESYKLYKKESSTQVFSCENCEIFKNIYFQEHLQMTTSELK